jgi:hypothetical protein
MLRSTVEQDRDILFSAIKNPRYCIGRGHDFVKDYLWVRLLICLVSKEEGNQKESFNWRAANKTKRPCI